MIAPDLEPLAVPLEQLAPLPGNPRRGDVEAVARSLEQFGQRKPVVATRDGTVIAGNHTLAAAAHLGWTHIAVTWVDDDEATARAFALADNRTHDLGTYDEAALAAMLEEVAAYGDAALLNATGYDEAELARLIAAAAPPPPPPEVFTDPDAVPDDAPEITEPGDVWRLGPHRLLCGSATDTDAVAALLADAHADVLWTDPPYGVAYVGKRPDAMTIENDRLKPELLAQLLDEAFAAADAVMRPGCRVYVAHPAGPLAGIFFDAVAARWGIRQSLVWLKDKLVLGHADYHYRHEPILYAYKPRPAGAGRMGRGSDLWWGDHAQTTVLEHPVAFANRLHPTMKPVDLISATLVNSSQPGQIVLDCFAGSGSTMIACHGLHRVARLVEVDPRYVDVICRRWQEHTGIAPVRNGTPHNFAETPAPA